MQKNTTTDEVQTKG